jgi:hypothetical protein
MGTHEETPRRDEETAPNGMGSEISSFVHNIGALQATMPGQMVVGTAMIIACAKHFNEFLEKNCEKISTNGEHKSGSEPSYNIPPDHFLEYNRLSSRLKKAEIATIITPQAFVVALVSQYDSFLGGVLRCLYRARPELLKGSERHLTYSQLCDFTDLEHAKTEILEKEVESVLRMSHPEQFVWMENRFGIPLTKDLPIWTIFVELTQRRHLFAHCNGKVSAQYLAVCDEHKVNHEKRPCVGDRLDVTPRYFDRAHDCVFEIGTKLAHVLWRKILPEERENADYNLLMLGYDLLVAGNYELAVTLGVFATGGTIKKHSSDSLRRRMVVNLAQAYKWGEKATEATKIIDHEDWSSCGADFQIAVAVMRDDFDKAAELMKTIAATNLLKKSDYREWPLFKEFRKSPAFLQAYQDIYGHQPAPVEPSPTDPFFVPLSKRITMKADDKLEASEAVRPERAGGEKESPPA